jgi:hypothetical protein
MFRFRYNLYHPFHKTGIPISNGSVIALCVVGKHSVKRLEPGTLNVLVRILLP